MTEHHILATYSCVQRQDPAAVARLLILAECMRGHLALGTALDVQAQMSDHSDELDAQR